jgi:hypothetical protein
VKCGGAKRSGLCEGRMEVCLVERRDAVPFLQLTESQTARHMAVLVDGQR